MCDHWGAKIAKYSVLQHPRMHCSLLLHPSLCRQTLQPPKLYCPEDNTGTQLTLPLSLRRYDLAQSEQAASNASKQWSSQLLPTYFHQLEAENEIKDFPLDSIRLESKWVLDPITIWGEERTITTTAKGMNSKRQNQVVCEWISAQIVTWGHHQDWV